MSFSETWRELVKKYSSRNDEEEEVSFVCLVGGGITPFGFEDMKALFSTYSDRDDYGTQECVEGAIQETSTDIYSKALVEELPRLVAEGPEWAGMLLARVVEQLTISGMFEFVANMPEHLHQSFLDIAHSDDFLQEFPEAAELML